MSKIPIYILAKHFDNNMESAPSIYSELNTVITGRGGKVVERQPAIWELLCLISGACQINDLRIGSKKCLH